jgi:hypothetical protein
MAFVPKNDLRRPPTIRKQIVIFILTILLQPHNCYKTVFTSRYRKSAVKPLPLGVGI